LGAALSPDSGWRPFFAASAAGNPLVAAGAAVALRGAACWFEALPDPRLTACPRRAPRWGVHSTRRHFALSAQQNHSLLLLRADRLAPPRCGGAQIPSA